MLRIAAVFVSLYAGLCLAQPSGSARLQLDLDKLQTVGSVLHIAAHPDDENTDLLAYFARGRNLRTGYLSLTRGEGGQNLIGSEQGDAMGLIRTQELLAARRVDGAEQFFTRAIDFGFTKTTAETFEKWGKEEVLGDMVWVIRRFRPDIIFLRFSGTPRDGHGQHQASALLGKEAFLAAADPQRFPEQLKYVQPWKAKRLLFNQFNFSPEMEKENAKVPNRIEIDSGVFNPLLGASYGEIAARSRSQHSSQAMGVPERRGRVTNHLVVIAGDPASQDVMEGIDTTWNRLQGGAAVASLLAQANAAYAPRKPQAIVPLLLKARALVVAMKAPEAAAKLPELDEVIGQCLGLFADASAERWAVTPGSTAAVNLTAVARLDAPVTFLGATLAPGLAWEPNAAMATNTLLRQKLQWQVPAEAEPTNPYWLRHPHGTTARYDVRDPLLIGLAENKPLLEAQFRFRYDGAEFVLRRPVRHRYIDSARGELIRDFLTVPKVAAQFEDQTLVFAGAAPRTVQATIRANQPDLSGGLALQVPAGWQASTATAPYKLTKDGEQATVSFTLTPPNGQSVSSLALAARSMITIRYPHIPPQVYFPPAEAKLIRIPVKVLSQNVGYIMGAGDEVPASLRQLGVHVTMLSDEELASSDLSKFDAIVTGVRAFNTRPALRANFSRLLAFMENGGTLVVQYNVVEGFPGQRPAEDVLARIGPYPLQVTRDRVTVEDAPMQVPDWNHPVMQSPNQLSPRDFEGWIQERGLYFAKTWDPRYVSLFASHDPNEEWLPGGMLFARYGKGAYAFTAYSWFRQLPAGVPGAYRIFANLLSAGKAK